MTDVPNPFGFSDGLRDQCRETCAEYGDPPCFMLPELCDPCDHITPCEECLAAAIAELVEGLRGLLKAYEALCEMTGHDFHKQKPTRATNVRAIIAKYGDKT